MNLLIDISEDVYTRLFDSGIQDNEIAVDDICEMARALRMGTPIKTVTNTEEAEAYPINQEENCNIVCDFLRDVTGIDVRDLIKETEND